MTKVVFVGEIYHADLSVGGGPVIPAPSPPGIWGPTDPRPTPPIYIPGAPPGSPGSPAHPIYLPPHIWGPTDPRPTPPIYVPGFGPPTTERPPYPDHSLPPFPSHPIALPPGGTPVEPPAELPPPAGHEDDMVVMVYMPGQGWSGASYDVAPDQGLPKPTPVG